MTDTANLEDGFYWVRTGDTWDVAEMQGGKFWLPCIPKGYESFAFDEIDPRPIKREDVKPKSWMDNITDLDSMGAGFSGRVANEH